VLPQFTNPPGYVPVQANVQMLRGKGNPLSHFGGAPTVEEAIEAGIMMAGTPDQVTKQVEKFYDHVGGFGHLLLMGQAGFLEHKETVLGSRRSPGKSIRGSMMVPNSIGRGRVSRTSVGRTARAG
jgi:hypothetical protein